MEGSSQNGPGGVNGTNGMSRAERFEDEKRRIIDSCFGRTDEDGARKPMPKPARLNECTLRTFANLNSSARIVYHAYKDYRGCRVSILTASPECEPGSEKTSHHHRCCTKIRAGAHAQSQRERKWDVFDRKDMDAR
jgi:hypothetical protein